MEENQITVAMKEISHMNSAMRSRFNKRYVDRLFSSSFVPPGHIEYRFCMKSYYDIITDYSCSRMRDFLEKFFAEA